MKKIKILLLLNFFILTMYIKSYSQEIISNNPSIWIGYFSEIKLNQKFLLLSDFQIRHIQQGIDLQEGRTGVGFKLNKKTYLINGIAYFNQQIFDKDAKIYNNNNELRLWQEIKTGSGFNNSILTNRFRIEERFFSNSTAAFFRLRHKIEYVKNVNTKIKFLTSNELLWQFNNETNAWDQNRTSIGIELSIANNLNVQFIFMSWWQFSSNTMQPTVRVNLMHIYY